MKHWSHYFLAPTTALLIAIGTILAASVYATYRTKSVSPFPESKPSDRITIPQTEDVEAELITVLPKGFEPGTIVRPAGKFVLMFDNQSRLQPLQLRLERAGVPRVADIKLLRKTGATKVLNLPPGDYQITEANHSDWTLRLTLTEH